MTDCMCHEGYDGYTPLNWVFSSLAPDVPGVVLCTLDDGQLVPPPVYVLFLKKIQTQNGRYGSRNDWACLPSTLFSSPEKAREAADRRKGA